MPPRSRSQTEQRRLLRAVALASCASVCGCGDTCFRFSSNSGTGNIQVVAGDSPCRLAKPMGTVQFRIGSSSASSPGSGTASGTGSGAVRHVFVTLRGVEAHEDSSAAMDSPDWQQLAPDLAEHPVQVDLLAPLNASTVFPVDTSIGVPAGVYRQIRMQLLLLSGVEIPEQNACGNSYWNCAVLTDGTTRPLVIGAEERPEAFGNRAIRISVDQISGGAVTILPGAARNYEMWIEPHLLVNSTRGDAVRLIPVFLVSPQ
jgi:hypothetical protein